ncbi:hypothetical protein apy_04900 [Aeropyrum pernix]|uniref:Uncharacterized protein n=1 Tax=Aeropyrum pernix TaxID=56636 RepID=A0A401H8J0_AERPX|nr:hypothetical protein apy_04900 [Aeropyrum pernix]
MAGGAAGLLPIILLLMTAMATGMLAGFTGGEAPLVCVYFYPWYSSDGRHWGDSPLTPVVDEPLIGYYDSRDPVVVDWQLGLISDAGVDCLFVSWWGPGSFEDEASRLVFQRLGEHGLKAAILVEPYLGGDAGLYGRGWWEDTLDYIYENFVEKYSESYLSWEGSPLVLAFNPIGMSYRPLDPRFTIRIVGNDIDRAGYQHWDLWPDYLAPWVAEKDAVLRVRSDGYVAITPRFDDRVFCETGVRTGCGQRLIDPDYALNAYAIQWEWVLRNLDRVRLVAVYSWNEYHERSMIEPHRDATAVNPDPYYVYKVTMNYVAKLEAGVGGQGTTDMLAPAAAALALSSLLILILYRARRGGRGSTP